MQELSETVKTWLVWLGPNEYVQALAVVLVFVILAKISSWFLSRVAQQLMLRTRNTYDDKFVSIIRRPISGSIVLVGIGLAIDRVELLSDYQSGLFSILKTVAILLWLVCALHLSKLLLRIANQQHRVKVIQNQTLPLFENLAVLVIIAGGIYMGMVAWDINVTAWLASAGVIGLALSFAAKDTLANLFAGVFILADNPYKIGDYIVLETAERGEVTHIGIRSTRILTRDDVEITVPNSIMGNTKIINESAGPHEKFRIRIQVSVAYGSDIDLVHDLLMQVAEASEDVCIDPEPRVRFRTFGNFGLNFELLVWVEKPALRGKISHLLNGEVYKLFLAKGIEIPYPKQDLYVKELPPRTSL